MCQKFLVWIGPAYLGVFLLVFLPQFGRTWTWGRYGMPRTLTGLDGQTYPDGSPIEHWLLPIVEANCQEELELGLLLIDACVCVWLAVIARRMGQLQREEERYLQKLGIGYSTGNSETVA